MTIENKKFTNTDVALIPVDDEYVQCNFARPAPDTSGPLPVGVRLFPGDDTPRIFRRCNLINCEPPPGSTLESCNTSLIERDIPDGEETITIDGQVVDTRQFFKSRIYGRWNPDTESYEYKSPAVEVRDT